MKSFMQSGLAAVAAAVWCAAASMATAPADTAAAYELVVVNPGEFAMAGYPVEASMASLPRELRTGPLRVSDARGREVPAQVEDFDGDGVGDAITFLVDLPPSERKTFHVVCAENSAAEAGTGTDLAVEEIGTGMILLRNKYVKIFIEKEDPSAWAHEIVDPATGKPILQSLSGGYPRDRAAPFLAAPGGNAKKTIWRLISAGPPRTVAEKAYDYRDAETAGVLFRYRMRYVLEPDSRRLRLRAIWENLTDRRQKRPRCFARRTGGGLDEVAG